MQFQGVNRSDPEKVFIVVHNDSGTAIGVGRPAIFEMDGTNNGSDVTDAKTATHVKGPLIAGLVHDTELAITDTDGCYGLVQVYGYDDDAVILKRGITDTTAGAIGDQMVINTASSCLAALAAGSITSYLPAMVLCETMATVATIVTTTAGVFLRLM